MFPLWEGGKGVCVCVKVCGFAQSYIFNFVASDCFIQPGKTCETLSSVQ